MCLALSALHRLTHAVPPSREVGPTLQEEDPGLRGARPHRPSRRHGQECGSSGRLGLASPGTPAKGGSTGGRCGGGLGAGAA